MKKIKTIRMNNGTIKTVFPACKPERTGMYFCQTCREHKGTDTAVRYCKEHHHQLYWSCECGQWEELDGGQVRFVNQRTETA